ncbi:Xylulose kinase [subsurface metagenome]|nr:hypothetical protein [Clostridia bacterium]
MDKKYFMGIDIGTSNIKGSVFSTEGEYLENYSISYNSYFPLENYYEQDPDDWVNGSLKIIEKLLNKIPVIKNFDALALSTQGGTFVPVDVNFDPLYRAITWQDRRAADLLYKNRKIRNKNIFFYNRTGWRLDSNISILPLYWLKENKKHIFEKIHKILFVNDYVQNKLCNNGYQDPSNASITLFFNIINGIWDKDILSLFDFDVDRFSKIKNSGELVGYLNENICESLRIQDKVKVYNGGHDQYCTALGAGILNEEGILLSTGTAWVIFKMLDKPLLDSKFFFAIGRNIIIGKFGLIYTIPAAGASIKWFASNVMDINKESEMFELIDKNSIEFLNLRNKIIFYPYLTGAFGPDFDTNKRSSFHNIDISHNNLDLVKAIMEGVGFQLKKILMVLQKKGIKSPRLKMVGGGTNSKVWPQIISDIIGKEIYISRDKDVACRGASMIAAVGAGYFKNYNEAFDKIGCKFITVRPRREFINFYNKKFINFIRKFNSQDIIRS